MYNTVLVYVLFWCACVYMTLCVCVLGEQLGSVVQIHSALPMSCSKVAVQSVGVSVSLIL